MLDQLMDPAFTHDFKTYLLPRMTTQEARSYAQTSLGLEAGDVWVFLDFLKDEHDKRSGMVDITLDQDNEDSLTMPWHHLPPLTSYPGQPQSSLALAAVALAQEHEAQGQPDQTIKDAREAETTPESSSGSDGSHRGVDCPGPRNSALVSPYSGVVN